MQKSRTPWKCKETHIAIPKETNEKATAKKQRKNNGKMKATRRQTLKGLIKLLRPYFWDYLGAIMGHLGPILDHFGAILAHLGLSWALFGTLLGNLGAILAETGFLYERSEGLTNLNDSLEVCQREKKAA